MKCIERCSILFVIMFAIVSVGVYFGAMDFFIKGFRFEKVYDVPIKTNCVLDRWAIENGKVVDMHNKYININIPAYGLYFTNRNLLKPNIIIPPGDIISTFKVSSNAKIVYSKSKDTFYISYYFIALFGEACLKWSVKVPELNSVECVSDINKSKHEFACLDKNRTKVLVYNEDGKMSNSIAFDKQVAMTSIFIDSEKSDFFFSDGEEIRNLDKTNVFKIPSNRSIENAFFLTSKDGFISKVLCYYDGIKLYGFDLEKEELAYSKEIMGLKPGIYSDRLVCPYKFGLLSVDPNTGSISVISCQNQYAGKSDFRALSHFKQNGKTYFLFENKNNDVVSLQIYEMDDTGLYRLMSNSVFPFKQIYLAEASIHDFYLFTDKGVYATDTFDYFYP